MLCAIWRNLNLFLSFYTLQWRQIYKNNRGCVDVGRTTTFCIITTRFMSHNFVVKSCMTKLLSAWTHHYTLMLHCYAPTLYCYPSTLVHDGVMLQCYITCLYQPYLNEFGTWEARKDIKVHKGTSSITWTLKQCLHFPIFWYGSPVCITNSESNFLVF